MRSLCAVQKRGAVLGNALVVTCMLVAVAGCGGGGDDDMGPVTWSLQGDAPVVTQVTGGPWTLTQLAPGNPNPPSVPNKSYGYNANFMSANAGMTNPMQPYYFGFVQGSGNNLQGYFDWRPKEINEGVVAASSTDGGLTWEFQQMVYILTTAVPRNQQSTNPDASLADDGFGHPHVIVFSNPSPIPTLSPVPGQPPPTPIQSHTFLYTLDRSAGVVDKFGLVVTPLLPTASMPLNPAPPTVPLANDFTDESQVVRTNGLKNPDGILASLSGDSSVTVLYIQKIGNGDASGSTALPPGQQCRTQPYTPVGASSPQPANHDLVNVRIAVTTDGVNFVDQGVVTGLNDPTTTSFVGTRWISPNGTLIGLGAGRYGLFFAAGNCMDADSDAFHYIGYAETTDPSLQTWTILNGIMNPIASIQTQTLPVDGVPTTIPAQSPVIGPTLDPWAARVYGPSVTRFDDDTVVMTFAGYHVQSPGDDLLDYRTILSVRLKASRPIPR